MSIANATPPLRVMLVDDDSRRRAQLEQVLRPVGCTLVACEASDADLLAAVQRCNPDLILIDIEAPGRDTLESLQSVQATVPRPMVMFSQDDDQQSIRRATEAGVSAYVVDGLQSARVRPIIDAAIARFQHFQAVEQELQTTRKQLAERKLVDRTKGIIMRQRGVSEEQAYQAMRKLAMDSNRKVSAVAQQVIETAALLAGQS